jgi:hypothetical protein
MRAFRLYYLPPNTLPIMAERGHKRTSREANEFTAVAAEYWPELQWQTALSHGGEYTVCVNGRKYPVDGAGFNANGQCEMVVEYDGCAIHGFVRRRRTLIIAIQCICI